MGLVLLILFIPAPLLSPNLNVPYNDLFLDGRYSVPALAEIRLREAYTSLESLIMCESGGNPNAIGKAGERGILQFLPSTFKDFSERYSLRLNIDNPDHQVELSEKMIKDGYGHLWTCTKLI